MACDIHQVYQPAFQTLKACLSQNLYVYRSSLQSNIHAPLTVVWKQVNAVYPGVKIVMMQYPEAMLGAFQPGSGSVTQGIDVLFTSNYPVYEAYHQAAYNRAIAAGISNVYYFEPSARVGLFSRGCTGHPSLAGHQAISAELIPYLKGMMAW